MKIVNSKAFLSKMFVVSILLLAGCSATERPVKHNYLEFKSAKEIQEFFRYKEGGSIIVSGHRGGREKHFPENSIEGFQNVLEHMPAFFEIDPRLTKDSVIVLMHDVTLDRTTNATGRLADYTWEELQDVRLKDSEGNVTDCRIPTLEEVIVWSKGKTVVNLDKKDVPLEMIAELIEKHRAETHVMLTVHNGEQARFYYDRFPTIMFSAFSRNEKEFEDMMASGVPASNMIAYVGRTIDESNNEIVEKLRAKGIRCMVSYSPTHDKLKTAEERKQAYMESLKANPDIVESDFPTEVFGLLK
ncbi:glycerophosphodiester phosphodiesterase family protein [Maribellus sp. CM-23]|uniref:glycerophosphodiester phosphodiesterase family protein n=1 Tax=Maribellus sp. CM-23 TaxID=2781026 RepID=UPI001F3286D8|nr:glycerophosphodiester phosphodiesterase family protein [Maribellus sp. CM-23]MCE4564706.1 glycerophosphodiester phosphodiesterase family protein [Maribellus sp. CM-23]